MKNKHTAFLRLFTAFSILILLPKITRSQDALTPCATEEYESVPQSTSPATTPYGTVGMSNLVSAEPLGKDGLSVQLRGNLYRQDQAGPGTPAKDARITSLSVGAAFGMNPYLDGFIGTNAYDLHATGGSSHGLGSSFLGFQGTLPLPEEAGLRLGLQLVGLWGTSSNPITTTLAPSGDQGATGYDYLETRTSTDLMARLTQSLLYTVNGIGVKFHFNEGVISSFQVDKRVLLVTGIGAQWIPISPLVLGLEINDRTFIQAVSARDPLWVTPSIVIRTPVRLNISGGADISLSRDHTDGSRSLEPWRGFAAFSYTLGTRSEIRRQKLLRKEIAQTPVPELHRDSVAVVPVQPPKQVERVETKPKRSENEKQLLEKGVLVLDAVYFQTAKTTLTSGSKNYLADIARMLARYPKLQIELSGHTDNLAGAAYNMRLSQGRAEAARAYMVVIAPNLAAHLSAKGYGLTRPKADNRNASGRKLNRRVELRVLNKEALQEYNLEEQR